MCLGLLHECADAVVKLCEPWGRAPFVNLEAIKPLHENTIAALRILSNCQLESAVHLHLYTDGSLMNSLSAWAVTVIGQTCDNDYFFVGTFGALVAIDGDILAAPSHESHHAEAVALQWAAAWLLQVGVQCEASFYFDAMAAGFVSAGTATSADTNSPAHITRTIMQLLSTRRKLSWHHVLGHSGQPWNELSDCMAKASIVQPTLASLPDRAHIACQARQAPWLAITYATMMGHPALPDWTMDTESLLDIPLQSQEENFFYVAKEQQKPSCEELACTIKAVSFNVQTLGYRQACGDHNGVDDVLAAPARAQALARQFSDLGILIAGLQEARSRNPGKARVLDYVTLASGATLKGTHGCELWFNTTIPYAVGADGEYFLSPSDLQVVFNDERRMMVTVRAKALVLDVMVLHAPLQTTPYQQLSKWWRETASILDGRRQPARLLVFADANAYLGSLESGAVGPFQADTENVSGEMWHTFLLYHSLVVPSTKERFHKGTPYTWSKGGSCKKRIDYIAVDGELEETVVCTWVDETIELAQANEDHRPICIHLEMRVAEQDHHTVRRKLPFNRAMLNDPDAVQAFLHEMRSCPVVPWKVDPHRHLLQVMGFVRDAIAKHMPKNAAVKMKPYLSERSWEMLQDKRCNRKAIKQATEQLATLNLAVCFNGWAAHRLPSDTRRKAAVGLRGMVCDARISIAFLLQRLAALDATLRGSLKSDRIDYINSLAAKCEKAADAVDLTMLHHALAPFRGSSRRRTKGPAVLPLIKRPDGTMVETQGEAAELWQRHFAENEAGHVVSQRSLVDACFHRQNSQCSVYQQLDEKVMPSLVDFEASISRRRRNRAAGEDGIPADVYMLDPPFFAALMYPLIFKSVLSRREPVQFKGGMLASLYKGAGEAANMDCHRGVLVADAIGKSCHSALRVKLAPHLELYARPTQHGGRQNRTAAFATQAIREAQRYSRKRGSSLAVLFIDVVKAFYSVLRQMVMSVPLTDDALAKIMATIGLPREAMEDLAEHLAQPTAFQEAGISTSLDATISEAHEDTWFSTQLLPTVAHTYKGTKPGDPLGDIVFNFLAARVLKQLEERLARLGIGLKLQLPEDAFLQPVAGGNPTCALEVSFVDDVAILIEHESPLGLIGKLEATAAIVIDTFAAFGLRIDLRAGKTEALVSLRGRLSLDVYTDVMNKGFVNFKSKYNGNMKLPVAWSYKHLGSIVDSKSSMRPEISRRSSLAVAAARPLYKKLFAPSYIPVKPKVLIAEAYAMSRHSYNMGLWPRLAAQECKSYHTQCMKIYRIVLAVRILPDGEHVSDIDVCKQLDVLLPSQRLRIARLRYLEKYLRFAPPMLRALVCNNNDHMAWRLAVVEDLEWVFQLLRAKLDDLGPPSQNVGAWVDFIRNNPKPWAQLLRRAQCEAISKLDATRGLDGDDDIPENGPEAKAKCKLCFAEFATYNQAALHLFRVHGHRRLGRYYADGASCWCCLRFLHCRERVVQHLHATKKGCLEQLVSTHEPLNAQEVLHLDAAEAATARGVRKSQARPPAWRLPALQAQGPKHATVQVEKFTANPCIEKYM